MADEQPVDQTLDAGMPEPAPAAETGEPTVNLPDRWSGAAVVPPAAPRRSAWARLRERVTGPEPVTDEWASMPAVDPWADQDTPVWTGAWASPVPSAETPPTRLDAPVPAQPAAADADPHPTRRDAPATRPDAAGAPLDAPGTRLDAAGTRLDAPGTRVDAPDTRSDSPGTRLDLPAGAPAAAGSPMAARATDRANEVADKASEMADRASEMAAEAARAAALKAEAAKAAVAKAFAERAERAKAERARAQQAKAQQVAAQQVAAQQAKASIPGPGTYPPAPAGSGLPPMRPPATPARQRRWGFGGRPAPAQRTAVRPRTPTPPARPAPPPWTPPRPQPKRRGLIRRWLRRLTLFTVAGAVLCCGAPLAYWQFPVARQFPVTAVLPESFSDLSLRDTAAGERAAQRLADELQAAGSTGAAFAGTYADGNGKRLTVFGVTGWRFTPGSDVDAQLERLTGQLGLTDVQTYDTGESGVHESCGKGRLDGTAVVACAWGDHGSLATAVLTRRSLDESATLVAQLRDEALTPTWRS